MKNVLKVWFKRRHLYNNPNTFYPQVVTDKSLTIEDVIEEIVKEGCVNNKECALEFMKHFNRKAAQLLLNGNEVDTGLVKMAPQTTGLIQDKLWNDKYNTIDIKLSKGNELVEQISETFIEVVGIDEEVPVDDTEQDMQYKENIANNAEFNGNVRKNNNDILPCGIAFRNWILKA